MVFSSIVFLFLFLPVVLTGYFLIGKKGRNVYLLLSSLVFYAWGEGEYISALLLCIGANYLFGILIYKFRMGVTRADENISKLVLILAVGFNVLFLVYYKYTDFFVANLNSSASSLGFGTLQVNSIHLPLGISFFVFQALSYVIDVYRRQVVATYNPIHFALYESLFPQLIAGPIVRYRDIAGQVVRRIITTEDVALGSRRFIIGLGKKVLIANTLAATADQIFAVPMGQLAPGVAWLGILCYTLQIYYDFSGYSDMAIGLGQMLGFKFPENFNYPYAARSIQDFWRRWHISLSTWFKDYVYIPLGGNRGGSWRTYSNLVIVFFLCGMWHGASWTFIVWGLWHGFFIVLERSGWGKVLEKAGAPAGHLYTLLVIIFGWVFFRSPDLAHSLDFIIAMFDFSKEGFTLYRISAFTSPDLLLALTAGIVFAFPVSKLFKHAGSVAISAAGVPVRYANFGFSVISFVLIFSMLFTCCMSLAGGTYNPFIYFRF